jgi:uncharacterized repeat protein (TIGR01451 family)
MLALFMLLSLGMGIGIAQPPQLDLALDFASAEAAMGDGLLGMLSVRNTGSTAATFDLLSLQLPPGILYVGQALGSELPGEPQASAAGLHWAGPFTLPPGPELVVRFWAVASEGATPGVWPVQASLLSGAQVLASSEAFVSLLPRSAGAPETTPLQPIPAGEANRAPALPDAVTVTKTAEPGLVKPGRGVAYSVTFANSGSAVTLDRISDILPAPFQYVGLAIGSEVSLEPIDREAPEIVWSGSFSVPAGGALTLRYWAWVPPDTPPLAAPYVNQVTARYGATSVGPASAEVVIKAPDITVAKEASPAEVLAGETVTYTVTFRNEGTGEGVLDLITDTLPAGFTFLNMATGSDVSEAPAGTTGTIVWDGPLSLPAGATLTLVYQVQSAAGGGANPTNQVLALSDGLTVGPAAATVRVQKHWAYLPLMTRGFSFPRFTVSMTAEPIRVMMGETVVYTVKFRNEGDLPGRMDTLIDTLPSGFTFLGLAPGSQVTAEPTGTTGTLTWTGPFDVPAGGELTLAFRAKAAETPGTYTNTATATTSIGKAPVEPAQVDVTVAPAVLFEDDYEGGIGAWTPFTNYWRLNPSQWYWDPGQGYQGSAAYTHVWSNGVLDPHRGAEDALTMYLGPGAQDWTDYRYTVRMNMVSGQKAGLWFRGTYREVATSGQWLTGYYFMVSVRQGEPDKAQLWQLRTEAERCGPPTDRPPPECEPDYYLYHFSNPTILMEKTIATDLFRNEWNEISVEVQGPRIRCYVRDELVFDYTDTVGAVFLKGTIGMATYGNSRSYAIVKYDDVRVEPLP